MTPTKRPLRTPKQVLTLLGTTRPSVPYKPTLHMFKGSNLSFNPATGLGHSYAWYEIIKLMIPDVPGKPTLVLNTYAYSSTTVRHYSRLRQVLRQLGLRYIEIQAPSGLQNLNAAADEAARQWARACVANDHARKPLRNLERRARRTLDITIALGGTPSQPLQQYLTDATAERRARLDRAKAKAAVARLALLAPLMAVQS